MIHKKREENPIKKRAEVGGGGESAGGDGNDED